MTAPTFDLNERPSLAELRALMEDLKRREAEARAPDARFGLMQEVNAFAYEVRWATFEAAPALLDIAEAALALKDDGYCPPLLSKSARRLRENLARVRP